MKPWFVLTLLLPALVFAQQDDPWADEAWGDDEWSDDGAGAVWSGFAEGALGTRFSEDPLVRQSGTLGEFRLRIESEWQPGNLAIGLKADIGYDGVAEDWIGELRDLSVSLSPTDSLDLKIGRQVQTWGTGDLLFLNDLFPKDFVSFFAGRDDEYLKAPGDAVRATWYTDAVNADFVWTPIFEPDVYVDGERFSFFFPLAGGNVAPDPPLKALRPKESFDNGEFALRLFKTVKGREYALYAYRGFFKQPTALTPDLRPTFAPLNAYGASLRQPAGPGLINVEASYYDSRDDRSGSNPLLPNDQFRFLAGYEWEARPNFTVGLQYYLEWTLDHDALIDNSPFPQFEPDERRHVLTNRLTWRLGRDRYTWSLFTFLSPSDRDFYVRPSFTWRYSDQWTFTAGASLFGGDEPQTFFNQLADASNAYIRVRFNY